MKMNTTNTLPKNGCWIFENRRYRCSLDVFQFPRVDAKYECVLKEHNIPYRKFSESTKDYFGRVTTLEFCEYWNSDVYETKEVVLPLYAKMPDNSYHYCERSYSENVPTLETITAAEKLKGFVDSKVEDYEQLLRKNEEYLHAKSQLNGGAAVVCRSFDTPWQMLYTIEVGGDEYWVLPIGRIDSDWVAIFNKKLIEVLKKKGKDIIYLDVPKPIAGLVIGKNHANVRGWAETFGVKEIRVRPI